MKTTLEYVENYPNIMAETSSKWIIGSYTVNLGSSMVGLFDCYIEHHKDYKFFSIVGYDSNNIIYINDYAFLRRILPRLCESLKKTILSYPSYLEILKNEKSVYEKSEYVDEYPFEIWKRICYELEKEVNKGNDINSNRENILKIREERVSTFRFKILDFEMTVSPNNSITFTYKNKTLIMETHLTEFDNPSVSFLGLLHCFYSMFMQMRRVVKLERRVKNNDNKK